MTDARLPERWIMDRRVLLTSAEAWRLYTFALMYAVTNRTDGAILPTDLPLIPAVDTGCADELVKLGLWEQRPGRWQITDFPITQTSRDELDQLERIRAADREKKRRQRLSPGQSLGQSPGTAQAGRQARQAGRKSSKTEGQELYPAGDSWPADHEVGGSGLTAPLPSPNPGDDNGPRQRAGRDQHTPAAVHLQSPAARGNARGPGGRPPLPAAKRQAILTLHATGGLNLTEIAQRAGVAKSTAHKVIHEAAS